MSWSVDAQRLVSEWMCAWAAGEPFEVNFEDIAVELHAHQRQQIAAFGLYCRSRRSSPYTYHELPFVPVGAYKIAQMYDTKALGSAQVRFETSGTSDGRPGTIALSDTRLYDLSLRASFHHFVVPDASLRLQPGPYPAEFDLLSLVPDRRLRPHSSLGHMVEVVAQTWAGGRTRQLLVPSRRDPARGQLDLLPLLDSDWTTKDRPVLLMATTLALDMLRSQWPEGCSIRLPAGSRLMDTGGPKGRTLDVSRSDQHQWLCAHLGLEPYAIVGELGMTELGSQRYERVLRAHLIGDCESSSAFHGPPWLRSVALSAVDLRPLPSGEVGMLAHIDLANFEPCAFVLTADRGRVLQKGNADCLELMGRIPGSEWRGCGLDVEALFRDSITPDP